MWRYEYFSRAPHLTVEQGKLHPPSPPPDAHASITVFNWHLIVCRLVRSPATVRHRAQWPVIIRASVCVFSNCTNANVFARIKSSVRLLHGMCLQFTKPPWRHAPTCASADKCGENEGALRAKLNYRAETITAVISIYSARSNEKRLEGRRRSLSLLFQRGFLAAAETFYAKIFFSQ